MIIYLSPVRDDRVLEVYKSGDALTINGEVFDFSPMPEGHLLPVAATGSAYFSGGYISRVDGEIVLTLRAPHGKDASHEARFPAPLTNVQDGLVELPK